MRLKQFKKQRRKAVMRAMQSAAYSRDCSETVQVMCLKSNLADAYSEVAMWRTLFWKEAAKEWQDNDERA